MAAMRKDVIRLAKLFCGILFCFTVRKKYYCSSDVLGLCFNARVLLPEEYNPITSCLWVNKANKLLPSRFWTKNYICLLLLLAGDIETDPGPMLPDLEMLCNQRGGKFFHQNVNGLLTNIDKVKLLLKDFPAIDILSLSETHIKSCTYNDNTDLYKIPVYTFINRNRKKGKSGGVTAYISNRLQWAKREDLEDPNIECTWIEVFQRNSKRFLLGTIYRPPSGSKYFLENFSSLLEHMLSVITVESKETILMGDLNIDYLKNDNNKPIKEIFDICNMIQIVTKPTRCSSTSNTLIDCILTTDETNIVFHDVIATSIADHYMVWCIPKLHSKNSTQKSSEIETTQNIARIISDRTRCRQIGNHYIVALMSTKPGLCLSVYCKPFLISMRPLVKNE